MDPQNQQPSPTEPVAPQPQPEVVQPLAQPVSAQPAVAPTPVIGGAVPAQPEKHSDGIGLASLITSILGFHLIGFILGLVGRSKAKAQGHKSTLSTIGMIWGIVGMLISLAVGAFLVFTYMNLGSTNKNFLNAALAKDYDLACDLWDAKGNTENAECKKFIESFANEYKSYVVTSRLSVGNAFRIEVTYTKNDGTTDKGYVDVEDGKVTNFVFGGGSGSKTTDTSTSTNEDANATPETSGASASTLGTCLADADVASVYSAGMAEDSLSYDGTERRYFLETIFFNPDASTYAYPEQMPEAFGKLASLHSNNPQKKFTIELQGKVKESSSTAAGVKLAHDRVAKVTADLVAKGVPASFIKEVEPDSSSTYADGSERNVDVEVFVPVPCS